MMSIHLHMKSSNITQNNNKLPILKLINLELKPLDKEHQLSKLKLKTRERFTPPPLQINQILKLIK